MQLITANAGPKSHARRANPIQCRRPTHGAKAGPTSGLDPTNPKRYLAAQSKKGHLGFPRQPP